jgi:DNA-directed RNA polymerase specialized sigma24 family protein
MSTLDSNPFLMLLVALDTDEIIAADKYELLRTKIRNLLKWRGCIESDADDLADKTLDRVAAKIAGGEKIDNIGAYTGTVARFIWLEHQRKKREDAVGDEIPEVAVPPEVSIEEAEDERIECLRECMRSTIPKPDDQRLITGYYDTDSNEKNKDARKRLAESLGMSVNTMKVRACRLRDKLERCINDCMARVTKVNDLNTSDQEVV